MPRIRQKAEQYAESDFFRELDARRGWNGCQSNRELAELVGVCESTVGNFLRKPDSAKLGTFRKIVKILKPNYRIVMKFLGYTAQDIKKMDREYEDMSA